MKLAVSSTSFADDLARGVLTQLEWLDLCAAELEADGVVFELRHFPRTDADYLAQLKKMAVDLGLTVAGLAAGEVDLAAGALPLALGLGAPLVVCEAPAASEDPEAWGAFTDRLKTASTAAKAANVPLALRNKAGTLCPGGAELKRAAKDVDSSWVRFALDAASLAAVERSDALVAATILAVCEVADVEAFARDGDPVATALIEGLRGYRGFVVVDRTDSGGGRDALHNALERLQRALAEERLHARRPAAP